jgi:hypothetical protein
MKDRVWFGVGNLTRYSDLSMIVLGLIVEQISGLSLQDFARQEIFEPVGTASFAEFITSKLLIRYFTQGGTNCLSYVQSQPWGFYFLAR